MLLNPDEGVKKRRKRGIANDPLAQSAKAYWGPFKGDFSLGSPKDWDGPKDIWGGIEDIAGGAWDEVNRWDEAWGPTSWGEGLESFGDWLEHMGDWVLEANAEDWASLWGGGAAQMGGGYGGGGFPDLSSLLGGGLGAGGGGLGSMLDDLGPSLGDARSDISLGNLDLGDAWGKPKEYNSLFRQQGLGGGGGGLGFG